MSFRRRIAYLSLETPKPGQASDTHVREIITELRRLGYEVDLFATRHGGASEQSSFLTRAFDYVRVQARLMRDLSRYDVIYIRSHFAAVPIALFARVLQRPVVHEVNGKPSDIQATYPYLARFSWLFSSLYRLQYTHAAALIAVTEGLQKWAVSFAAHDRVVMISNAANTNLFRPNGPTAENGGRFVIFVGGLVAWHGIDTMIDALKEDEWPKDVALIMVGDGIERSKVERCKDERFSWLGRRPYDEIPPLLRASMAALCVIENPAGRSSDGVAPLKMFEAMACGVPVIVSDLPFQADIVRSIDAGIVVPPNAPKALAKAVADLSQRPELAAGMGKNGARYVAREASWHIRAEQLHALFGEL